MNLKYKKRKTKYNDKISEKDESEKYLNKQDLKEISNNDICEYENNDNENDEKDNEEKTKHYILKHSEKKSIFLNDFNLIEKNKLYIKNITPDISKTDLNNYFSKIEGYQNCRLINKDKKENGNFAYIDFDNEENINKFLKTLKTSENPKFKTLYLNNFKLLVSISKPSKQIYEPNIVFVQFTKYNNKEDDNTIKKKLLSFFNEKVIKVKEIRLNRNDENEYAYVELEKQEDVLLCVENIKIGNVDDLHFNFNYSIPIIKKKKIIEVKKLKMKEQERKYLDKERKRIKQRKTIIVNNLNYNTRKYKLKEFFETIGEIDEISLVKKIDSKKNRGYAFITFKNINDATSSLILNNSIIDGRNITVSKCIDKKKLFKKLDIQNNVENIKYNNKKENIKNKENIYDKENIDNNENIENQNKKHEENEFNNNKIYENTSIYKNKKNYKYNRMNSEEESYLFTKKRINLSSNNIEKEKNYQKNETNNLEKKNNQFNEMNPSKISSVSLTNEDFRKLFIK